MPVTTTPTPSGPLDCDFQESSCSWTIENGLDEFVFYWNRTNGELLLDNSLQGPETDHKGDAKGKKNAYFMVNFSFLKYVCILLRLLCVFKCNFWNESWCLL